MSLNDILAIKNNRMIKQLVPENLQNVSSQLAQIATEVDTIVTGMDNYYVKCLSTDT